MEVQPTQPVVRNYKFDFEPDIPRDWHKDGLAVSAFFNNLSIFFPAGERFFVRSVNRFRHKVDDPDLLSRVRAFTSQEAIHTREHLAYNQMLRDHGYPVDAMDARVERLLRRADDNAAPRWRLAVTCALEHFTAIMGEILLTHREFLEGSDPTLTRVWLWHALEENEHKSVAFEVYTAAGGNYFERCIVMLITTFMFWAKVAEQQVRMMKAAGCLWSAREWYSLTRALLWRPGLVHRLVLPYLAYFKPGFRPWHASDEGKIDRWREAIVTA